jgi:hypothetical protein
VKARSHGGANDIAPLQKTTGSFGRKTGTMKAIEPKPFPVCRVH